MKPVYIMLQNEMIIKTMVDHKDTVARHACASLSTGNYFQQKESLLLSLIDLTLRAI